MHLNRFPLFLLFWLGITAAVGAQDATAVAATSDEQAVPANVLAPDTASPGATSPAATSPAATSPDTAAAEEIELTPEQQAAVDAYVMASQAWAQTLVAMKSTSIRFANEEDQSPAAREEYRRLRDQARRQMNEVFQRGLELFKARGGDFDSASMMATTLEYREQLGIYENSHEAAMLLIDRGITYPFMYLIAARSAFLEGKYDQMMKLYEDFVKVSGPEKLERVDNMLVGVKDIYPELWQKEQALLEAEAKADDLPRVELQTTRGMVVIELFENQAPNTVANFIKLVESGYYDETEFYQVVDDFLAMGGDPVGDGTGTSGQYIPDEYQHADARGLFRGYLCMAKAPNPADKTKYLPNSASSQFAIALMPLLRVEETQTIFGRVIEGMDVVCSFIRIDPTEKKEKELQLPPDRILSAKVLRKRSHAYEVNYIRPGR